MSNNERKYEFTGETMEIETIDSNYTLHQIRAIKDFGDVKAGDLGGCIMGDDSLDHKGNCWVEYGGMVYGNAVVKGNAKICSGGNAVVKGNAKICWSGSVDGHAIVYGNALVYGGYLTGNAVVYENAQIHGGDVTISGNSHIGKDAVISSKDDFIVFSNVGSRYDTTTFYKTESGCSVSCGCFNGTVDEFEAAVEKTHGNNKYGREYKSIINTARIHFGGR